MRLGCASPLSFREHHSDDDSSSHRVGQLRKLDQRDLGDPWDQPRRPPTPFAQFIRTIPKIP